MHWPWSKRKQQRVQAVRLVRGKPTQRLAGKYDAAQTTDENRRHWANADALSADAAASAEVRRIVRNRARYEVANNSYARGIVLTLANDLIGTGPRLQLLTDDGDLNVLIEREFARWARAVNLAGKLRTMRMARAQDGEAFAVLFTNEGLDAPVKLDLRLIEADQVATPSLLPGKASDAAVDGIVFDEFGNPVEYHVLKRHPGGKNVAYSAIRDYDRIPAEDVIHWFRADRPGQHRGLSDIMPALPLFALLRRYTLAVLTSAETAAEVAVVMKTTAPAGGEAAEVEPMVTMEFERNMAIFAPEGWEPSQMKAEQPATTYPDFKNEIINEIARCLNMPFNVAACNSSAYNYASGRLDHQTYFKSIRVERGELETVALDRILSAWLAEAVRVPEFEMFGQIERIAWPHQWFWDGREHVDPLKEANAQAKRLETGATTLAIEYAKVGLDWEEQLRQRAKEVALMRELGLPLPKGAAPAARLNSPKSAGKKEEEYALPSRA